MIISSGSCQARIFAHSYPEIVSQNIQAIVPGVDVFHVSDKRIFVVIIALAWMEDGMHGTRELDAPETTRIPQNSSDRTMLVVLSSGQRSQSRF
jgi:hypothetical protein